MKKNNARSAIAPSLGSLSWTFGVLVVWITLAICMGVRNQQEESSVRNAQWVPFEKTLSR